MFFDAIAFDDATAEPYDYRDDANGDQNRRRHCSEGSAHANLMGSRAGRRGLCSWRSGSCGRIYDDKYQPQKRCCKPAAVHKPLIVSLKAGGMRDFSDTDLCLARPVITAVLSAILYVCGRLFRSYRITVATAAPQAVSSSCHEALRFGMLPL